MDDELIVVSLESSDTLHEQLHKAYMLGTFYQHPIRIHTDRLDYLREVYPAHLTTAREVLVGGARVTGPFDALLSTTQAAARLRVTPQTVRNWIRAGRIPTRPGYTGALRVPASALDDLPSGPDVPADLIYWLVGTFGPGKRWTVGDVLGHPDHGIYVEPRGNNSQARATSLGKYLSVFIGIPQYGYVLRRHENGHRASEWSVEAAR